MLRLSYWSSGISIGAAGRRGVFEPSPLRRPHRRKALRRLLRPQRRVAVGYRPIGGGDFNIRANQLLSRRLRLVAVEPRCRPLHPGVGVHRVIVVTRMHAVDCVSDAYEPVHPVEPEVIRDLRPAGDLERIGMSYGLADAQPLGGFLQPILRHAPAEQFPDRNRMVSAVNRLLAGKRRQPFDLVLEKGDPALHQRAGRSRQRPGAESVHGSGIISVMRQYWRFDGCACAQTATTTAARRLKRPPSGRSRNAPLQRCCRLGWTIRSNRVGC
jgi:hypothetical protein